MDAHFKENERSFKIHETAKYERGVSSVGSGLAQRLPNDYSRASCKSAEVPGP